MTTDELYIAIYFKLNALYIAMDQFELYYSLRIHAHVGGWLHYTLPLLSIMCTVMNVVYSGVITFIVL